MNSVTKQYQYNSKVVVGTGFIAIPFGVDRDNFVETCYRTERVCIVPDHGGTLVKNCYIDSGVLQQIKFPENYESVGSRIVFIVDRFSNIPIVVANISKVNERLLSSEGSFVLSKKINDGELTINGDGSGNLLINLFNVEGSLIKLNIKGKDSVLEVNSDGIVTYNSVDDITFNSKKKVVQNVLNERGEVEKYITLDKSGLHYSDDKGNNFTIDYINNKIIHHEGSQPIVKGEELLNELNKLKNKLDSFINSFSDVVPVPSDGGLAIQQAVVAALVDQEDADFSNINSEKSFID